MHFDDRLITVLRQSATSDRAMRTQFRQLLDLLGTGSALDPGLAEAAWMRLHTIDAALPAVDRATMLRDPGLRLRNPELVKRLAEAEPEVAAAALAKAELSAAQWDALVPALPVRARGFLRLRRNLPESTLAILERLGVHDRGLPLPHAYSDELDLAAYPANVSPLHPVKDLSFDEVEEDDEEESEIGALVKRIEAFQKARTAPPATRGEEAPRLPLGEGLDRDRPRLPGFAFSCDADGRIDWTEPSVAAMLVGLSLRDPLNEPPPQLGQAFMRRAPLQGIEIEIEGAPAITGKWVVDATPRFTRPGGRFYGYAGKFRRPPAAPEAAEDSSATRESDSMRQLLHELRTPVNAIQGFAEVIQQQLFGPAPHEYRALAATIAGDAARMLAGFDELDRLARLETGALELDGGRSDFASVIRTLLRQLDPVLKPRTAGFEARIEPIQADIPLSANEAEVLGWRILATLVGTIAAGEILELRLETSGAEVVLLCELPASLAAEKDVFAGQGRPQAAAVTAGMFGAGFALKLARAEARAAGGDLLRVKDSLYLTMPYLTARKAPHSEKPEASEAAG